MNALSQELTRLLRDNPALHAAWTTPHDHPEELHIVCNSQSTIQHLSLGMSLTRLQIIHHQQPPYKILITLATAEIPTNTNQACQNEPIKLGCQIQPAKANWVGTAGAPIRWIDPNRNERFGILSNWHVMASGGEVVNRPIGQPTSQYSPMANLTDWQTVTPLDTNYIDAAIADALIDGYHTISPNILDMEHVTDSASDAVIGMNVSKSGRTTGKTHGKCTATGAAARVSYGNFSAVFADQDIFEANHGAFSAPGDSGSAILTAESSSLTSLLFAGNRVTTIGNPIRHIIDTFNLQFPFQQRQ